MLAETTKHTQDEMGVSEPAGRATFIPSALLLLMALDNGWEIIHVKPVVQGERAHATYLVTLHCHADGKAQRLLIPKSPLVEKIFEQHTTGMSRPC